ncbi:trafficking protein particle complex subunit 9-like isoform 1 [Hibiscus syriacus]|uniref:non-specific serine/threonine protein kinase n=1 Tax=Hibiscus syriacus TaxID=106335 RepID=A0A6A2X3X0_HIBSY|nr:trafficking protein particle complex subunit 9-like isoform 1 [Hibiscus syriacus]
MMKKKLLPLLLLLCLVSFHETVVVFAVQGPVSSPISSPFFPGTETAPIAHFFSPSSADKKVVTEMAGSEEHKRMSLSKKMLIALGVACSSLGVTIVSLFCLWICYRKSSLKPVKNNANSSDAEKGIALAPFLGKFKSTRMVPKEGFASFMDYKKLAEATNKFHQNNILGIGGFGCVYKAQFVDGSYAAVKKLECSSHDAEQEFQVLKIPFFSLVFLDCHLCCDVILWKSQNEVDLLSNFKHPNIISLLGFSSYNETSFIVYELMQNGSLETQLHGPSHGSSLTWHRRMKVAMDIARIEYLHELCNPAVIHRDLKSSNILLDSDFNAKLSDFGLAVTDADQNKNNLKLSGTLGYLAPEYLLDGMYANQAIDSDSLLFMFAFGILLFVGKLTDKSDVYAFGIVLLELLLGRKPVEKLAPAQYISIVTWAIPKLIDRSQLPNIVDPVIKNTMDLKHLCQVAAVAVLCVQPEPSYRPLITDVLHSLIPLVPTELGGTLRVEQSVDP